MKKPLVLLSVLTIFMIAMPVKGFTEESISGKVSNVIDRLLGKGDQGGAGGTSTDAQQADNKKRKFIIYMKSGGKIETDNYDVVDGKVRIMLPSGAITLEKSNIVRVEEVKENEGETVQKTFLKPEPYHETKAPVVAPPVARSMGNGEAVDNNDHSEDWWRQKVREWQGRLEDASKRYKEAEDDWDKYNGILVGASTGVSTFQTTQYQDLRGSARVRMDEAQAQMDEANKMLNEVLPEEAHKAGAPPGWAR